MTEEESIRLEERVAARLDLVRQALDDPTLALLPKWLELIYMTTRTQPYTVLRPAPLTR